MNLRHLKQSATFSAPTIGGRLFARARTRSSLLYFAISISAIAHALAYWATPHFINAWNAPAPARFDAVLVADAPAPVAVITPEVMQKAVVSKPKSVEPRAKVVKTTSASRVKIPSSQTSAIVTISTPSSDDVTKITTPEPQEAPKPADVPSTLPEPVKPTPATDPEPIAAAAVTNTAAATSRTEPKPDAAELNFPNSINIDYKMTSSVANGIANLAWKRTGSDYEIDTSIQATGFFTSMFVGVFRQVSRGEVTSDGVRPNFFSLQRGEAGADTAEFNRASKELKIIKHGETHLSPLPERMQDMQSFLFQMAHDAAQLKPDQNTIDVQVTNARKVYQYKFKRIGEEIVQTRLGAIPAIHLKSEAADPEDVYEVWLSPQHFYMPIKLKFFMGRFPIEQVASSVKLSEANTSTSGARK